MVFYSNFTLYTTEVYLYYEVKMIDEKGQNVCVKITEK